VTTMYPPSETPGERLYDPQYDIQQRIEEEVDSLYEELEEETSLLEGLASFKAFYGDDDARHLVQVVIEAIHEWAYAEAEERINNRETGYDYDD